MTNIYNSCNSVPVRKYPTKVDSPYQLTDKMKNVMYYAAISHPNPLHYQSLVNNCTINELDYLESYLQFVINNSPNECALTRLLNSKYKSQTPVESLGKDEMVNIVKGLNTIKLQKINNLNKNL